MAPSPNDKLFSKLTKDDFLSVEKQINDKKQATTTLKKYAQLVEVVVVREDVNKKGFYIPTAPNPYRVQAKNCQTLMVEIKLHIGNPPHLPEKRNTTPGISSVENYKDPVAIDPQTKGLIPGDPWGKGEKILRGRNPLTREGQYTLIYPDLKVRPLVAVVVNKKSGLYKQTFYKVNLFSWRFFNGGSKDFQNRAKSNYNDNGILKPGDTVKIRVGFPGVPVRVQDIIII
jgi:hypothetical protein